MTSPLIAAILLAPAQPPPVPPGPIAPISATFVAPPLEMPLPLSPAGLPPIEIAPLPISPVAWPAPAAGTRYFFTLFGGQSLPFKPRTAHTWANFAKATFLPDGSALVESFTISWLPAHGPVVPWRLWPEKGRNYTLAETFAIAEQQRDRVSMWGPFEINAMRYELAIEQKRFLESGAVKYRVFDSLTRDLSIQHCVHAVTYADPVMRRYIQPVLQVGEPGTSRLAARYIRNGSFIGGSITHDWLIPAIGADEFPVVRRIPGERIPRQFRP